MTPEQKLSEAKPTFRAITIRYFLSCLMCLGIVFAKREGMPLDFQVFLALIAASFTFMIAFDSGRVWWKVLARQVYGELIDKLIEENKEIRRQSEIRVQNLLARQAQQKHEEGEEWKDGRSPYK